MKLCNSKKSKLKGVIIENVNNQWYNTCNLIYGESTYENL